MSRCIRQWRTAWLLVLAQALVPVQALGSVAVLALELAPEPALVLVQQRVSGLALVLVD